ncbi:MAG: type II toxin-antitoxin system HicB family antitoxin [Anaerolineales bacterium]|jgi:predicted RNase H-like HicB family nuclease|nr:type II toxin-antitoxin system HicB family antitoxin [Anaerolineales bacterium]
MAYIVCAEEMDGRWIAHVPDLPGCYSAHKDRDVAIKGVQAAVEAYVLWCQRHGLRVSGLAGPMMVSEVIRAWTYEDEYEVSAFFASDRPPVMAEELDEFRRLLEMTRQDLLAAVEGLAPQDLAKEFSGERWPILGILRHVANADVWYLDRLGLALPRAELPEDVMARLERVRGHLLGVLTTLASRTGVVALSGELWSARKVLRRTLWHERDHTDHILKLRAVLR